MHSLYFFINCRTYLDLNYLDFVKLY